MVFQQNYGHIAALEKYKTGITLGERLGYVGLNAVGFDRVPTVFIYLAYRRQTVLWMTDLLCLCLMPLQQYFGLTMTARYPVCLGGQN